jgi:hypothetical protein
MEALMSMRSFLESVFSLLVLLMALISPAAAQPGGQSGLGFAMIGIACGQSARLNVLNMAPLSTSNQSSCTVTFQFLDSQGQLLKQTTANLTPGTAGALDLSFDEAPGGSLRSEIRGVLLFGYSGGANPPAGILQQTACGNLTPSLEVYDNGTGRTSLILTDAKTLPPPATPAQ